MTFTVETFQLTSAHQEKNRIESLQQFLKYPISQYDPEGSRFWFLRPGNDETEALETCPIAVAFYSELNEITDGDVKTFLTSKLQQQEIYGHYINRQSQQQPVMYLLLPSKENSGRIALVLPTEGGLRQRNIKTFTVDDPQFHQSRLPRLVQGLLPIATKALCSVPLVDWVFYEPAKTARELAQELAKVTKRMEQAIPRLYKTEKANGYLHQLLQSFQKELLPNLKLTAESDKDYSFADIYAQTITYGLFTARVFGYIKDQQKGEITDFNRQDAWQQLPETNPFLRRLFKDVSEHQPEEFGDELIEAISEVVSILRAAKMEAILSDFQQKMNQEDIVIRFYEDFLKAYNPQMRELRGIYFSPQSVASYIVRSVDQILKRDFGLVEGLADASTIEAKLPDGKTTKTHKVLITDPAVGTGTFLHSVIDHIYQSKKEDWSDYVSKHLLPRLLGFELLMAPYAVAHMKLGLQLANLGYQFNSEERLRVYLTNTLQEAFQIPTAEGFDNWIRDEADAANRIKQDAPVMVILGNPPYSGHSANNGTWITKLLKGEDILSNQPTHNYFAVDGKPLGERNPKWLNDDYVKFIRFAQWRIEQTGYGILAFVTNHGYLDNPTFRGMRQSLMETFDNIYVLDLHGNSKKKEKSPDGSKDENVFDIQQGVAIGIFVKRLNGNKKDATVCHADLWGIREGNETSKYEWLKKNDINTTQWKELKPQSSFYLFIPQNTDLLDEYEQGWKITDIFPVNSVGIVTGQDQETIALTKNQAEIFADKHKLSETTVKPILYRPFDERFIVYDSKVVTRPRREVMRHMLSGNNLGLVTVRKVPSTSPCNYFMVTDRIIINGAIRSDNQSIDTLFPLYLYPEPNNSQALEEPVRYNLSQDFLNTVTEKLGYLPTPEEIFYYIYAILHSPTYRQRYAEFLKIDFPRVLLTSNKKLFEQLVIYGEELVSLHLMKSLKFNHFITQFISVKGRQEVTAGHPKYNKGDVLINNQGDKFTGIPESVWNFYVGGYQPCQKWLKDRKGRKLSDEDIQHYQKIVVALQETIVIMERIDTAIPEFPIS